MLHRKHRFIRSSLGELKRTWFPGPPFLGVASISGIVAMVSITLVVSIVIITLIVSLVGITSIVSLVDPSGPFHGIGRASIPLGFLVPLYSSFSREGLLANMNRRLILSSIKKKGGITFTELKENLGLQNGVLAYHLSILQKNHFIKSFSDGKFKRFYVKGTKISGLTSAEEHIMTVIQSHPNISRRSIAERIDCSQGTVNMNLRSLLKKELISVKKEGKHFTYLPRN